MGQLLPALGLTPWGRCGLPAQLALQLLDRVLQQIGLQDLVFGQAGQQSLPGNPVKMGERLRWPPAAKARA